MISNGIIERVIIRQFSERCDCATLPWLALTPTSERSVGRFARRTDADLFAVARELNGWRGTSVPRPARAIVVVEHGYARVLTEGDVEVVILDLDTRRSVGEHDLAPVHCEYASLLARAGVAWPISDDGRRDVSQHLMAPTAEAV